MELQHPLGVVTGGVDGDILHVLASVDGEFSAPQLHRILPWRSLAGIRYALGRLVDQGIVLTRTVGRARAYTFNERHLAADAIRTLAAQKSALLSRLRDGLASWPTPPIYAALYGSAARSDMTVDSDLDILLIRDDSAGPSWFDDSAALAEAATAWTGNDARIVDLHVGDLDDDAMRPLLRNIVAEGVTLSGESDWLASRLRRREAS